MKLALCLVKRSSVSGTRLWAPVASAAASLTQLRSGFAFSSSPFSFGPLRLPVSGASAVTARSQLLFCFVSFRFVDTST